jgi:hypothetical protein
MISPDDKSRALAFSLGITFIIILLVIGTLTGCGPTQVMYGEHTYKQNCDCTDTTGSAYGYYSTLVCDTCGTEWNRVK